MNKKVPLWFVLLLLWCCLIGTIMFGWAVWRSYQNKYLDRNKTTSIIRLIASGPHLIKTSFKELANVSRLIRPVIYPNINGLKVEKKYVDSNYILLSIYDKKEDQAVVKLLSLCDQKIIHQWKPDFVKIKKQLGDKNELWKDINVHNIHIIHPLLLTDGSIIFDFGLLIKIDKNSNLVWFSNGGFSHSIECDADGNIWSPSKFLNSKLSQKLVVDYQDDAITKVSPNGKVLFKKSVAAILMENGYRGLLLGTSDYDPDLIHLNDIQPAIMTTKYWIKGDLLVSIRHKSTVMLYRPSTNKVLWLKTGPWLNQHDVDFIDSSRIGIFGNDVIRDKFADQLTNGHNEEYIFDFKTGGITTPYTEFLAKARVATLTEGRSDILPNGDLFIEETNNNRLLKGDKKNILWQYVQRIDQNSVSALTWSRFITKDEFKKLKFLR